MSSKYGSFNKLNFLNINKNLNVAVLYHTQMTTTKLYLFLKFTPKIFRICYILL